MELEELKKKLRTYKKKDIIVVHHAEMQAYVREVDLEEVKENIANPDKLVFAQKQKARRDNEEKYNCYFAYSNEMFHRYAIVINGKIIIVTIIKVNRNWQRAVEGKK